MKIEAINYNEIVQLSCLQPDSWVDIVPHYDFYTRSEFCYPIQIIIDGKIAGIGTTVIHDDVAWLAHIIVHKDYRCRGLGQLITQTLTDIAKQNKCTTIYLIATELGEPVYRKKGFITETEYLFYKNSFKKEWVISDNIRPYEMEYKNHFSSFDKHISSENRITHVEKYLNNAVVYCNEKIIEGYYLPTLGEGLIIADTDCAGIELLKLHLKQHDSVVFPKENNAAQRFLREIGFEEIKAMKRMRFGYERTVRFENMFNRIGGNVG